MDLAIPRRLQIATTIGFIAPAAAGQQWTAVVLHPPAMRESQVTAVNGTHQGGYCDGPTGSNTTQAGLWTSSAASWTPFTPTGQFASIAGMDDGRQVGGWSIPGLGNHAVMWLGTAGSVIDLHPAGYYSSGAAAVRGSMQVGGSQLLPGGITHACLWGGSVETFVDLHPSGAMGSSQALCTDGVLQGGWVAWENNNVPNATVWHGTSGSVVNLRPGSWSRVHGAARGVQVGQASPGTRAAMWRGTPGSYVDLSPPGGTASRLWATTGTVHVGSYGQSGLVRAGINCGTPESWTSLHQFLPPQYSSFSDATSVYQSGDTIYVGGWAENSTTSHQNAILWIGTLPCYNNCDNSTVTPILNVADFTCFLQRFASADPYANCDQSTTPPTLNVADFTCFLQRFAAGCP